MHGESQEPFNAAALRARREKRERSASAQGSGAEATYAKKQAGRFTNLDFCALAIDQSLESPAQVMEYAQVKGGAVLQSFVAKHQRWLQEYIGDAREWSSAPSVAGGRAPL